MKIAIMQPYFFPYIGYWQLIHAVDDFVIFDDVNFIKRGWINRNNILLNNQKYLFSLKLANASQNKLINQTKLLDEPNRIKLLDLFKRAYFKAPHFGQMYPLLEDIINNPENELGKYVGHSIKKIAEYLGIQTRIVFSSEVEKDNLKTGQDKIIEICKTLHGTTYINPIGGIELYDKEKFRQEGIELLFIRRSDIRYKQLEEPFIADLSILDVLIFNDKEVVVSLLDKYSLI